jgi:hypothetical protein
MVCLILIVIGLQMLSAIDTEIKIKTVPKYEVQVSVMDYSGVGSQVLKAFKGNADKYGDISFVFSSTKPQFGLIIYIKLDGETVAQKKELDYMAGEPIYIELAPKWFDFIETPTNNSEENTTIVASNESSVNNTVLAKVNDTETTHTGFTIFGGNGLISNKVIYYYIIIGVLLLVTGLLSGKVIRKKIKNKKEFGGKEKKQSEIVVKKLSEMQKDKENKEEKKEQTKKSDAERLMEAEKKIVEAQEEIKKIKESDKMKQERIKEAKNKLIKDQEELMKLRRGED